MVQERLSDALPMKTLFFCLLAMLLVQTADVGRACEYCRMAAEDPEAARLALAAHASSGAFPLQSTINQFKGDAPPAVLTAPPSTGAIATSAADLPARARRLPSLAVAKAPAPVVSTAVSTAAAQPVVAAHSATWANAGLLGVFGFLGFFGWRTRRAPGSVH